MDRERAEELADELDEAAGDQRRAGERTADVLNGLAQELRDSTLDEEEEPSPEEDLREQAVDLVAAAVAMGRALGMEEVAGQGKRRHELLEAMEELRHATEALLNCQHRRIDVAYDSGRERGIHPDQRWADGVRREHARASRRARAAVLRVKELGVDR